MKAKVNCEYDKCKRKARKFTIADGDEVYEVRCLCKYHVDLERELDYGDARADAKDIKDEMIKTRGED